VKIVATIVRGADCDVLPIRFPVIREADVSHVRILATEMAAHIGFKRADVFRLATAVSELGYNLVFHTTDGGRMSVTPLSADSRQGIEVVAEDDGPGISNIALAMSDGFTTNHGLGGGLPGCRRLMDEFAIASTFGIGTRIVTRLWR
jgi:serine/threonine-protein kinase RsbT